MSKKKSAKVVSRSKRQTATLKKQPAAGRRTRGKTRQLATTHRRSSRVSKSATSSSRSNWRSLLTGEKIKKLGIRLVAGLKAVIKMPTLSSTVSQQKKPGRRRAVTRPRLIAAKQLGIRKAFFAVGQWIQKLAGGQKSQLNSRKKSAKILASRSPKSILKKKSAVLNQPRHQFKLMVTAANSQWSLISQKITTKINHHYQFSRNWLMTTLSQLKQLKKKVKPSRPSKVARPIKKTRGRVSQAKVIFSARPAFRFQPLIHQLANYWHRGSGAVSHLGQQIATRLKPKFKLPAPIAKKLRPLAKFSRAVRRYYRQRVNKIVWRRWKARISRWWPVFLSVTVSMTIIFFAWSVYDLVFKDLPSALDLTQKDQIVTTRILDRNGELLYRVYEDENRTIVSLSQVPQNLINATIAIEDKNFYGHHGFSLEGIFRAGLKNLQGKSIQGGSTITQQLIKNRLLTPDRTFKRKIRELILAILVEGTYSKAEILRMYLNEVPYGGAIYGIESASWKYFNKPATQLSLGESALLAGLPAAPSVYNPFGSNPELAKRRQEEVLRRMVEDNYISLEEAYQASQEELHYNQNLTEIKAPHFVMYVKKLLADRFGEQVVNQGGLEVRTTLDLNLQQQAEKVVTQETAKLVNYRISNGAALVTNPQTGEILAMVGSKDYFDFAHDGQVNVTLRPRQPGSSIKPLTYALAFETGKHPYDRVDDSPITYHLAGTEPYSPKNYDGKYHGSVTIRQALASSYNIPAVKTLASLGVNRLIDQGQKMGLTTWSDRSRFGLSLTLGAGEVLMTDLAKVYGAFANGGYTLDLDPFIEIRDYKGNLLYRNECFADPDQCPKERTISGLTAYQITSILSDNAARSSAFGTNSVLHIPNQEVAVKTGTTNSMRDNWTIGYTSNRLVAVWVGNNDNTPMSYVASGITGASPIWNQITRLLLDDKNPHRFSVTSGLVKVKVCAATGTLPCAECPLVVEEIYQSGSEPKKACTGSMFKKATLTPAPTVLPGQRPQLN